MSDQRPRQISREVPLDVDLRSEMSSDYGAVSTQLTPSNWGFWLFLIVACVAAGVFVGALLVKGGDEQQRLVTPAQAEPQQPLVVGVGARNEAQTLVERRLTEVALSEAQRRISDVVDVLAPTESVLAEVSTDNDDRSTSNNQRRDREDEEEEEEIDIERAIEPLLELEQFDPYGP